MLNAAQVGGSALAAVTAAVAASTLGMGGTLLGAAFGAVVTSIGGAIYIHSFERAGNRLRSPRVTTAGLARPAGDGVAAGHGVAAAGGAANVGAVAADRDGTAGASRTRRVPWVPIAALSLAGFTVAVVAITASEAVIGHPVSGGTRGSGTTVGRILDEGSSGSRTTPTPTVSGSPTSAVTPSATVTPTPSPTDSAPATQTGTPTEPAAPSGSPTGTDTGAVQPVVPTSQ